MSFCGDEWEIFGRITEASEDAEVEEVPGEVCSVRIVVPWAMQAYSNCVGADGLEAMARWRGQVGYRAKSGATKSLLEPVQREDVVRARINGKCVKLQAGSSEREQGWEVAAAFGDVGCCGRQNLRT